MHRRTFLQSAAGAVSAGVAAPAPTGDGVRLGIDTYSIRDYKWKALELLDYAGSQKLDAIQISSIDEFESLEPPYLAKVRDRARSLGIRIDAGIGSVCPTSRSFNPRVGTPREYLVRGLRTAKAVGAGSMRCFMGSQAERHGSLPIEAHMEAMIKALRSARNEALDTGVKIAVENHSGDLEAREVKTIIEEAGKDYVGSCLDAGNPMWVLEDPELTLEVLGPYVLTTHFRDSAVYEHPRGAAFQWVALGDGSIDFQKFLIRFKQVCPQASIQLEIITGRPPSVLPYLEPEYWRAFPNKRAAGFARFLALAKKGHPYQGPMMIAGAGPQPPEFQAALKLQQKNDLERSLNYARHTLGLGIRWRT
ncbi:MAG: sugar phosphate isomerase/epimerase [Bryobacterales bacterium]|nr:sugar phosphate isomerase/epimerase [Bryobacterales bacterium]